MTARRFKADPAALYLCDNGACYCGAHLGMTAKATGRDISGQRVLRLTDADRAEHPEIVCEGCAAIAPRSFDPVAYGAPCVCGSPEAAGTHGTETCTLARACGCLVTVDSWLEDGTLSACRACQCAS